MGAFRRKNIGTSNYIPEATAIVASNANLSFTSIGQTIAVSARVEDQRNRDLVAQPAITMDTLDHSIATVSGGVVTSVAQGNTTLRITSGTITLDVPIAVAATGTVYHLIFIDPVPSFASFGSTAPSRARIEDQNGNPYAGTVTYDTDNHAVATVDASGTVTAVGNGTCNVIASSAGLTNIQRAVTVTQVVASVTISPTTPVITVGSTQQFTEVAKDANGNTVVGALGSWSSSDATDLPIDANGLVVANSAGSAVIKWQASNGVYGTTSITANAPSTTISPVYNGQQNPQALVLFGGVAPESALSLVDQNGAAISSGVTWSSDDPTNCPINATTGVISPSAGVAGELFVTFTGTVGGNSATVKAHVYKGGWTADVISSDDLTDYAGNQATADAALLAHISSHANDINTSTNSWDPTGTVRQPTGPANARYIQVVNANWMQADATNRWMGRNTIKLWFPGGQGGSAQPQIVFGTTAVNAPAVSPTRLHHLRLERFDPGFTTQGDLTLYNSPGTGPDSTAASYKNGPWDGFSNYGQSAATTITNSTEERVLCAPAGALNGGAETLTQDLSSYFTGANAGKWRLVYTLEETIDNRMRVRKWAVLAGSGKLQFIGETIGSYLDTINMPAGAAKFHQSTVLGANWNRTRAALPGGTQSLNRGPWYMVNGDAQSDPFGILAAIGEAAPTLGTPSVTTFNAGDTGVSVVVPGTNLNKNIAVLFSDTHIRVQSVSYDSSTQLTVVVNVLTGLTPGAATLQLKNTATGATSGTAAITTTAKPLISSVSPTSLTQGSTGNVVLTGKNFTSAAAGQSVVFGNAGITINSTSFDSATQITANVTVSAGATTGAGTVKIHDTANGDSATKNISVVSATLNIPAGLSGVGMFAEDFSGYANDTALKASTNVAFGQSQTTYGQYDGATTYNGHGTYKNRLQTDGYQGAIQQNSTVYNGTGYKHKNATYRATIKWAAGTTCPSGGHIDLMHVYPQDTTLYRHDSDASSHMVRLYIQDIGSGVLHYKADIQLQNTGGGNIVSPVTVDLGAVGAELTNGYTIDYLMRVTHGDSTHFTVNFWIAKNVSGTVASAMRFNNVPATSAMSTADANLYQGKYQPMGYNTANSAPAAERDTWVCQMEVIDEDTNPDWYGLINASGTYTPLT